MATSLILMNLSAAEYLDMREDIHSLLGLPLDSDVIPVTEEDRNDTECTLNFAQEFPVWTPDMALSLISIAMKRGMTVIIGSESDERLYQNYLKNEDLGVNKLIDEWKKKHDDEAE